MDVDADAEALQLFSSLLSPIAWLDELMVEEGLGGGSGQVAPGGGAVDEGRGGGSRAGSTSSADGSCAVDGRDACGSQIK